MGINVKNSVTLLKAIKLNIHSCACINKEDEKFLKLIKNALEKLFYANTKKNI